MEYAEERGWWERVGDRTFEKEEWKKDPKERFRVYVNTALNIVASDLSPAQMDWFNARVFEIPSYETYNPFAVVLGFAVLDKDHKANEKLFKKLADKHAKKFQLTPPDVLRYARKWQSDWSKLASV